MNGLRQPLPVAGYRLGVESSPAIPHEQRHFSRLDLSEDRDDFGAGPLHGVDRRLTRRRQQGAEIIVELAVADGHRLDGHPVLSLHLLLDEPHPCGESHALAIYRAGRPAVEQPGAQFALLGPGQLDDLLGLAGPALDQGERLQDRVVHLGGHVRPLLRPDPGLTFHDQIAGDTQPPGGEHHHDRGNHQRDPAQWPQQSDALVPGQQRDQAASEQQGRERQAQHRPGPPVAVGQARQWLGQAPHERLLVGGGVPPDQHDARDADDQRPGQVTEPGGAECGGDEQHHDQQRPEAGCERDAPPVGQRLSRNVAVLAVSRHQQPGQDIGRRAEAAQQGGQHKHSPHDCDVDARPRSHAGRHPAGQAVLPPAPQRPAAPGPPRPSAEAAAPEAPAAGPRPVRRRVIVARRTLPRTAGPTGRVPARHGAGWFLHLSIIAP